MHNNLLTKLVFKINKMISFEFVLILFTKQFFKLYDSILKIIF